MDTQQRENSFSPAGITVEINGKTAGGIKRYSIACARRLEDIVPFGQAQPRETVVSSISYEAVLSRLRLTGYSVEKIASLSDFTLKIIRAGETITLEQCNWTELTETADETQQIVEKIIIRAGKRTVNGNSGESADLSFAAL